MYVGVESQASDRLFQTGNKGLLLFGFDFLLYDITNSSVLYLFSTSSPDFSRDYFCLE